MSDSVKDILTQIGYTLRDCGNEYRAKPLYRDSDNHNVLCIKKDTGVWFDFKENKYGKLEDLVKLTLNLKDVSEAKDFIKNKFNYQAPKVSKPKVKSQSSYRTDNLSKIYPEYTYWENRGIDKRTLEVFESGVMKDGKLKGRYVFPIFDKLDRLVGCAGRDVTGGSAIKWKLLGEKKFWVYPFKYNQNHIKESKKVFLVESIGDMLSLWEAGIKNTLVLFGLNVSSKIKQILIMLNLEKIYICLNNDENGAGNTASQKVYSNLLNHLDTNQISIELPTKNDFGCMSKSEILKWKNQINP
jgi:hypothetical protein